jgi:hypothetical protein
MQSVLMKSENTVKSQIKEPQKEAECQNSAGGGSSGSGIGELGRDTTIQFSHYNSMIRGRG